MPGNAANNTALQSQTAPSAGTSAFAPGARGTGTGPGFRGANRVGPNRVLRNQLFTNPAIIGPGSRLANTTFRGRFAARAGNWRGHWLGRHRFWRSRVLGWYGPVFWPYAYYDVFDYAFWPYAYDEFWPYAYDDLYGGIFGPYAYGYGPPAGPSYPPGPGPDIDPERDVTGSVQVCNDQASVLANWPIERIAETVKPTGMQAQALDELARATRRGIDILKTACPTRLPSTPTGRLAALQSRLEAMLRTVDTIAPALRTFYESLDEEQRARFDSMGAPRDSETAEQAPPNQTPPDQAPTDLAQACDNRGAGIALPMDRIEQEVRPNPRQRAALENLANASARAADMLRANCPADTALTPVGRGDAMRQRLTTMLDAVIIVRPALEAFYATLDYEQRARFNVIGADEG